MLTIRTAAHVRGARTIKGFHSCHASTGVPLPHRETWRRLQAELARSHDDPRRRWLADAWHAHEVRLDSVRGH